MDDPLSFRGRSSLRTKCGVKGIEIRVGSGEACLVAYSDTEDASLAT